MRQSSLPPRLDAASNINNVEYEPDVAMLSDGETTATGPPPPPHIAARLHRASKRASTSSSRRNSISSLHSGMSNRSGYSRTQNHHIAQHLRRASILEDRKAKIAERNAHAELVRMRAQQNKAAPRMSKTREERAIAAQQAREKHLAQVAASCAEEVKRAKKIAEETREKKAAEHLKMREEMEEKLADANRRRQQQLQQSQRRSRTLSLPAVEEKTVTVKPWKPKSQTIAARVIQNAWRNYARRQAMNDYLSLNLDVASVQSQTFEAVSALVADAKVLSSTRRLLNLCDLLNDDDAANREACVRIFLSAYLILGHPKELFSQSGDLEEELIGHAKMLLMQLQRLLSKPATAKTFQRDSDPMISLTEAWDNFQRGFAAWKSRDATFIIEGAIAQFVELDVIWQTVKNDTSGGVAKDYKEGIRNNQALILARLKRLLGTERAFKMINDAVRKRRKASKAKKPDGDVKPRVADQPNGSSTASTSASSTSKLSPITFGRQHVSAQPWQSTNTSYMNALLRASHVMPDNRDLIHELAINKDFRLDVVNAAEDKQTISRALFNQMRIDVADGNGDPWILAMAEWIKERLLRLVTPGKESQRMITEFLDPETIARQLRMGNFSYDKFFSFMCSTLAKLCAPVRDPEVKALATDASSHPIERLEKLKHVIELLGLDHANYLMSAAAPELLRLAPKYEHDCFRDDLASGSLDRTLKWWRLARSRTTADIARRSPEGTPPKPISSSKIYTNGLVDLFISLPSAGEGSGANAAIIPETLVLDTRRIERSRADVLRIVTVGAILLTAKNLLKRDVRTQWRTQAQRMWDLTAEGSAGAAAASGGGEGGGGSGSGGGDNGGSAGPSTTTQPTASTSSTPAYTDLAPYLQILDSTSGASLPPSKRQSLAGTIETVLANARASPAVSHPVMKVLLRKIREHAMARLGDGSEEKVRAAATAGDVLGAGGMAEFVGRIGGLVDEMARIRQVDWDAHGRWINQVAEKVERESGTESG